MKRFLPLLLVPLLAICVNGRLPSAEDFEKVYAKRVEDIITSTYDEESAHKWMNELDVDHGNWSDVDYTTGCLARRANWPIQDHFHRIITMASLFHRDKSNLKLLDRISLALNHWFDRDYHSDDCINAGGVDLLSCPCGTPGFWNTNWYCQMILIPGLVGNACLLLKGNLTETQLGNCTIQTYRAYIRIDGDPNGMMGPQTGANMLDVSSVAVSLSLLTNDPELLAEALGRYYDEAQVTDGFKDGIKIDGSFMQHSSQLYNGNYGQVFMRAMLKIMIQTSNTSLSPPESVHSAFLTVINGSEWFMHLLDKENDPFSPLLLWQYSVIGRMVSHKYEDWHGIGISLDEIIEATSSWPNHAKFLEIVERLRSGLDGTKDNPGPLVGTRYFYTSDYLVHRGETYIVGLKMFSSRTTNSECNNNQNPFGFHLSDGTIYSYIKGDEYINVYGSWDWNLIPGTTVDYGVTPLSCSKVQFKGVEEFVGAVTLDSTAVAVMNYTNPLTGSFHWSKNYFFHQNTLVVQFTGDAVASNGAEVVTTLDQKQLFGPVYIDGIILEGEQVTQTVTTLWHDRIGYRFLEPVTLSVDIIPKQSNWSEIGISIGNETQNLFVAYFYHPDEIGSSDKLTYVTYFDISQDDFENSYTNFKVLPSGAGAKVRGLSYNNDEILSFAFWTAGSYETELTNSIHRVETDVPALLIFMKRENFWELAVSDPTQTLQEVNIRVFLSSDDTQGTILSINLPNELYKGSTKVVQF